MFVFVLIYCVLPLPLIHLKYNIPQWQMFLSKLYSAVTLSKNCFKRRGSFEPPLSRFSTRRNIQRGRDDQGHACYAGNFHDIQNTYHEIYLSKISPIIFFIFSIKKSKSYLLEYLLKPYENETIQDFYMCKEKLWNKQTRIGYICHLLLKFWRLYMGGVQLSSLYIQHFSIQTISLDFFIYIFFMFYLLLLTTTIIV